MATTINPGYQGYAEIGDDQIRFSDASIVATQTINIPDLMMGDHDRDAYNYGPIEVSGSISGPVTEKFGSNILPWAVKRISGTCERLEERDITLYYYCGGDNGQRTFTGMYANSVNFSVSAGDVANFSLDTVGKGAEAWQSNTNPTPLQDIPEKIITWDQVSLSISGSGPGATVLSEVAFSDFDFTVENNLETVYSLSQDNMFPFDIVPGLRNINGSMTVYNIHDVDGVDNWGGYEAGTTSVIRFNIGPVSVSANVQLHRIEPSSSVGPVTATIGFTGVTHQSGSVWE